MKSDNSNKRYIIKTKARNSDYVARGLEKSGYIIVPPYKEKGLMTRLLREVYFRLPFPKDVWFNPEVQKIDSDYIIIYDALMTPEFVEWVCKTHKNSTVELHFNNRVDSLPFKPTVREPNLIYTSFDKADCEKYDMQYTPAGYMDSYAFPESEKRKPEYDVVYLGRDKGRAQNILALQKCFEAMGLRTYFHITADRSFFLMRHKKKFYKPMIPYEQYIELLKRTRAHLNYVQEGQTSITQRDMESVFDSVKCITNNKGIKEFELYDPSRFFVLGEDDLSTLPAFLDMPFSPVPQKQLDKYRSR